jgi:DNA-binding MarR family transcriptional regulator
MSSSTGSGNDAALDFVAHAVDTAGERIDGIDVEAMRLVLLLHRVTNAVVYDLESTVHRPSGWSWSAFRALFTLWIDGPLEPSRLAETSGMSRQAVSALAKTLAADGLITRSGAAGDGRSVLLALTDVGRERLEEAFRAHNEREGAWSGVLSAGERATFVRLLAKLAAAAARQDWVHHRF